MSSELERPSPGTPGAHPAVSKQPGDAQAPASAVELEKARWHLGFVVRVCVSVCLSVCVFFVVFVYIYICIDCCRGALLGGCSGQPKGDQRFLEVPLVGDTPCELCFKMHEIGCFWWSRGRLCIQSWCRLCIQSWGRLCIHCFLGSQA